MHAIALAPGGGIYAATSPDGKIYRIDAAGKSSVLFDPPDRYIWSLIVDQAGNVFAGTGDKGVIYKIAPDGKGAPFYNTKATHVMTLAFDRSQRLLAGTESPGRVFQLDTTGKPFVLLDSPYNEIRTLRVDAKGNIYAAAVTGRGAQSPDRAPAPAPEPAQQPVASVSTEVISITIAADVSAAAQSNTPTPPAPPRGTQALGTGAVYRIMPDGASDLLWQLREDAPYDMAFEPDGSVLVATGNEGKIYRLAGDPVQPTLVARAPCNRSRRSFRTPPGECSSPRRTPARCCGCRPHVPTVVPTSRTSGTPSRWPRGARSSGRRRRRRVRRSKLPRGRGTRARATRPGATGARHTPIPTAAPIVSPRARYLQWRAVLTANRNEAPVLTSVTAAYLPRNSRPRVSTVNIHPPGTVFQRPFPTGEPEIAGFEGETPERRAVVQNAPSTPPPGSAPAWAAGRINVAC